MLSKVDWKAGRPICHLWRQDINGTPVQLTFSEGGDIPAPRSVRWAPDGKTILFLRDGQIQLIPPTAENREPSPVTPPSPSSPTWSPDGTTVYFLASDPPTSDERERDRLRDDVYAFEENYKPRQLWKVIVATGAEQQLTTGESSVLEYRLSRDGSKVAMQRGPTPLDGDGYRGEVWVMDATGGNARALTRQRDSRKRRRSSRPTTARCCSSPTPTSGSSRTTTRRPVRRARRRAARRSRCCPISATRSTQAAWAPDGKSIFAVVNHGRAQRDLPDRRRVAARAAADRRRALHPAAAGAGVVPSAGKMVFQFDEPSRFGDVWTLPIAGGAAPHADARHRRVRHARARLRAAAPGKSRVEGRRRQHRSRACCSIRSDYRAGRALSARRADARRADGVRQVRRRIGPAAELLPGARPARATPCCGRTTAAAPATATPSFATSSAATSSNMAARRDGRRRRADRARASPIPIGWS